MGFIPAANVMRVALKQEKNGQEVVNVFHFKKDTAITESDFTTMVSDMYDWYVASLLPCISSNLKLIEVDCLDLTTVNGASRQTFISSPPVGTRGNSGSQDGIAVVVTHRTGNRGRNFRGRTYVGDVPTQDLINTGVIGTTLSGLLLTAFQALMTPENVAGLTWGVLSLFFNKSPRAAGLFTPITGVSMDSVIDAQRRRQIGRGI